MLNQKSWFNTEELNPLLKLGISITTNINYHKFYRKGNCRAIMFKNYFKTKSTFGFDFTNKVREVFQRFNAIKWKKQHK